MSVDYAEFGRRPHQPERNAELVRRAQQGDSIRDMSAEYGISRQYIYEILKRNGYSRRGYDRG